MRSRRVRRAMIMAIGIALSVSPGCAGRPAPKPPVKIAISAWPGYAHAFIAREKGLFKKNGVQVELVLKKEQIDSLRFYKGRKTDGLFTVMPDAIILNARRMPAVIVCIVDYSQTGDVIIGRPEFNSLADLKDKKVSFEGINTFSHMFVLMALENAGLKESDLFFEDLSARTVLSALEEGRIDAGHTWEPTKSEALRKGYKVLAEAKDVPGIMIDVLAFRPDVIRERPQDIKAILKALFEARDFIRSNRREAVAIMALASGMETEEMALGLDSIAQPDAAENVGMMEPSAAQSSIFNSWQIVCRFLSLRGQISYVPDYKEIVEPSYVKEIAADTAKAKQR